MLNHEFEAMRLIEDVSCDTEVALILGVNVHIDPQSSKHEGCISLLIDPIGIDSDAWGSLEKYASEHESSLVEWWGDWGRFLRLAVPKYARGAIALSPPNPKPNPKHTHWRLT